MSDPIAPDCRLVHAADAAWRTIDGQAVVVSADTQKMRVLNDVGSRIWELCDGRTFREVVTIIANEYEADAGSIEADATAFARDLLSRGMLEVKSG